MTKRRFYKTIITVEVLSKKAFSYGNLTDVHNQITDGDCSGVIRADKVEILNGLQASKALLEQGSDPEFFRLDFNGNDSDGL